MSHTVKFTAVLEREDDTFVAHCPELDIANQGPKIEEARSNLTEAIELFFSSVSPNELGQRAYGYVFVASVEVKIA